MLLDHIQTFFIFREYLISVLKSIMKLLTPCYKIVPDSPVSTVHWNYPWSWGQYGLHLLFPQYTETIPDHEDNMDCTSCFHSTLKLSLIMRTIWTAPPLFTVHWNYPWIWGQYGLHLLFSQYTETIPDYEDNMDCTSSFHSTLKLSLTMRTIWTAPLFTVHWNYPWLWRQYGLHLLFHSTLKLSLTMRTIWTAPPLSTVHWNYPWIWGQYGLHLLFPQYTETIPDYEDNMDCTSSFHSTLKLSLNMRTIWTAPPLSTVHWNYPWLWGQYGLHLLFSQYTETIPEYEDNMDCTSSFHSTLKLSLTMRTIWTAPPLSTVHWNYPWIWGQYGLHLLFPRYTETIPDYEDNMDCTSCFHSTLKLSLIMRTIWTAPPLSTVHWNYPWIWGQYGLHLLFSQYTETIPDHEDNMDCTSSFHSTLKLSLNMRTIWTAPPVSTVHWNYPWSWGQYGLHLLFPQYTETIPEYEDNMDCTSCFHSTLKLSLNMRTIWTAPPVFTVHWNYPWLWGQYGLHLLLGTLMKASQSRCPSSDLAFRIVSYNSWHMSCCKT